MSITNQLAATRQQIDARSAEMEQMGELSADTRARIGHKFRLDSRNTTYVTYDELFERAQHIVGRGGITAPVAA